MCGIVGFTGSIQAKQVLLEGLKRLEYRGYDSAGIAVNNGSEINIVKRLGKVSELVDAVQPDMCLGACGIGHTRWATHGAPSERNAHPHTGCAQNIAVVHNGIIENFAELRAGLRLLATSSVPTPIRKLPLTLLKPLTMATFWLPFAKPLASWLGLTAWLLSR